MPPEPLLDLSSIDLTQIVVSEDEIRRLLPQRYEFAMLDGILHVYAEKGQVIGFKDLGADDWWVRGHIPGRPLLPGVLMIEAGAQLAALYNRLVNEDKRFLGFGGVDKVKFRGTVVPPCRLLLLGQHVETRPRRTICAVQGLVNDKMVFEGVITGMPL